MLTPLIEYVKHTHTHTHTHNGYTIISKMSKIKTVFLALSSRARERKG